MASWPGSYPSPHLTCVVPSLCLTWPCPQMAVLEIQANGDTRVTKEAIARARHSLSDPNMRVSSLSYPSPLFLHAPVGLGRPFGQAWGRSGSVLLTGASQLHKGPSTRRASPGLTLHSRPEGSKGSS